MYWWHRTKNKTKICRRFGPDWCVYVCVWVLSSLSRIMEGTWNYDIFCLLFCLLLKITSTQVRLPSSRDAYFDACARADFTFSIRFGHLYYVFLFTFASMYCLFSFLNICFVRRERLHFGLTFFVCFCLNGLNASILREKER